MAFYSVKSKKYIGIFDDYNIQFQVHYYEQWLINKIYIHIYMYIIKISNTLPFWRGFYPLESFDFLARNPPYYYFVYYFGMYCTSDRFGDKIQQVAGQWCDCSIYTS